MDLNPHEDRKCVNRKSSQNKSAGRRVFEFLLSDDQFKKINKFLPQGYSLAVVSEGKQTDPVTPKAPRCQKVEPTDQLLRVDLRKETKKKESKQLNELSSEVFIKCKLIVDLLKKHPYAQSFLSLSNSSGCDFPREGTDKEVPDIVTVNQNLMRNVYRNQNDFEYDVRKIWFNVLAENPPGSKEYHMAKVLSEYFDKLFQEWQPELDLSYKPNCKILRHESPILNSSSKDPTHILEDKGQESSFIESTIDFQKRENLASMISKLPSRSLLEVWKIVSQNSSIVHETELEFDIRTLDQNLFLNLEKFVLSHFPLKIDQKLSPKITLSFSGNQPHETRSDLDPNKPIRQDPESGKDSVNMSNSDKLLLECEDKLKRPEQKNHFT
jgi:hypothetical protein